MSSPRTVIITGANRGIGLGLVKHLLALPQKPEIIFATYRTKDTATELFDIAKTEKAVHPLQLDVTNYSSYQALVEKVSSIVGSHGLNLLINNAGVAPGRPTLSEMTAEHLIDAYKVNAVAPVLFTQAFTPLLRAAVQSGYGQEFTWSRAAVVNVSSIIGSIEKTTEANVVHYRMTKAALNMYTKCLSVDLKPDKILTVAIHPGWVRTDMGGPKGMLSTDESVTSILQTLSHLNPHSNGQLLSFDGAVLPY